jgi:hypothetical protein
MRLERYAQRARGPGINGGERLEWSHLDQIEILKGTTNRMAMIKQGSNSTRARLLGQEAGV